MSEREYFTEERCHITELLNNPDEDGISIAQARVEPGVTTRWHSVTGTDERYLIVSGTGTAEYGDESVEMSAGDNLLIPAGVRQRITNTGADDLIFLCVCTPRFRWENYAALEEQ